MNPNHDPIQLEIFKHRFRSLAEEMGAALCRSAYSSNIKERKDFSCAIFDTYGRLLSQAEHLPVHLGSMPLSVQAAIQAVNFEPGDSVLLNDPFAGGTHLPDITMVEAVFIGSESQPCFYVANRAHHADVGGMSPGSMPLSKDIFQEGLRIPAIKWRKKGLIDTDLLALILNNVRTPREREGDLLAQHAANQIGVSRLIELCQTHGTENVRQQGKALQTYAADMMRAVISKIPDGIYSFADALEDDGCGQGPLAIMLKLTISGDAATVDFNGTAPQTQGCVNTILAVTLSCVFYAFRCLLDSEVPSNSGCLDPIQVIAPQGSLVNAQFPSAVVGGNVETSQRLVDVLFGALAQALPDQIPAASCGSMNNLIIGGSFQGQAFAYYETLGGGMGGGPLGIGASGIHSHMTNTLNTPIEALELSYPFRVRNYALRKNSAGQGLHPGGEGLIREIEMLAPAELTLLSERRSLAPYGLKGGQSGGLGKNILIQAEQTQVLPGKVQISLKAGERIRIETPGGGGWGEVKSD
jgi:N-methylhydantoinase B